MKLHEHFYNYSVCLHGHRATVIAQFGQLIGTVSLFQCTSTRGESIYKQKYIQLSYGRWQYGCFSLLLFLEGFSVDLLHHGPKQLTKNVAAGSLIPCR